MTKGTRKNSNMKPREQLIGSNKTKCTKCGRTDNIISITRAVSDSGPILRMTCMKCINSQIPNQKN